MRSPTISTKIRQIAEQAVQNPDRVFTNLGHLLDVELLREAYHRTRKNGAPGIDGVRAAEYALNLEANLRDLEERLRSGKYVAPPVKRVWIDKEDGSQRPIGMPVFEDKIVQRAVSMLLGAVYEQDFHDFSYGFREGRNPHGALKVLRTECLKINVDKILDVDVSGFFDSLEHATLLEIIRKRVNDGVILRLVGKWLNAGVLDGDSLSYADTGTPQGGVISPLLANIYLHHVLDEWYVKEIKPRLKGRSLLIRFADDFVMGFESDYDAKRVFAVLPKRFLRFGLTIHPQKTKMISFRKPGARYTPGNGEAGTFDFLGFTHYWAKSLQGYWIIKRKTIAKRLRRAVKSFWNWCRDNRHEEIKEQYRKLCEKLRGYYQYFGIRGNYKMLEVVYEQVQKAWRYWLSLRSQKSAIPWDVFGKLIKLFPFPKPRITQDI